jgi:hypothetical protein
MDVFYHPSNITLNEFVDRALPLFGKERNKEYETRRCGVEIYRKKREVPNWDTLIAIPVVIEYLTNFMHS